MKFFKIFFACFFLVFFSGCKVDVPSPKPKFKPKKRKVYTKKTILAKAKLKKRKIYIERLETVLKVIFIHKNKRHYPIVYRWKKNGNEIGKNSPFCQTQDDGNYTCEMRIGKKKWTSNTIKYQEKKSSKSFWRPFFSRDNPYFFKPFLLHMATNVPKAKILYTTTNAPLTPLSRVYQKPILVTKSTLIHCCIINKQGKMGPVETKTYIKASPLPNYHYASLYMPLKTELFFKNSSQTIKNIHAIVFPHKIYHRNVRVNLHGNGSLEAARKSFEIKLYKKGKIIPGFKSKSFFILGLSEDAKYYKMHFAFQLLKKIGLFFSFHDYTELLVNGQSRGVALIVEKVQKAIKRKDKEICGVVRRESFGMFAVKYQKKGFDGAAIRKAYKALDKIIKKYQGEQLWKELSKTLNLKMYMKWLAFNTWIQNGDYTDELFLGAKVVRVNGKERIYFKYISGWDYDTIFEKPHLGISIRYPNGNLSLVYSGETNIDKTIAYDPYLYRQFKIILKKLLEEEINEKIIDQCLDNTKKQLLFYLSRIEVYKYKNSFDKDAAKGINFHFIKDLLEKRRKQMKERRTYLLKLLKLE